MTEVELLLVREGMQRFALTYCSICINSKETKENRGERERWGEERERERERRTIKIREGERGSRRLGERELDSTKRGREDTDKTVDPRTNLKPNRQARTKTLRHFTQRFLPRPNA